MHWTLEQVRDLDLDEFAEVIAYLTEKSDDDDSVDVDQLIEARRKAKAESDANG